MRATTIMGQVADPPAGQPHELPDPGANQLMPLVREQELNIIPLPVTQTQHQAQKQGQRPAPNEQRRRNQALLRAQDTLNSNVVAGAVNTPEAPPGMRQDTGTGEGTDTSGGTGNIWRWLIPVLLVSVLLAALAGVFFVLAAQRK